MDKKYIYIGIITAAILGLSIRLGLYYGWLLNTTPPEEGEEEILLIHGSGVIVNYSMTMSEIKSDNYTQIVNKTYHFINSLEIEYDLIFSGVSLWSILEVNLLLNGAYAELTYQFVASDGYHSPPTA